MTARDTLKAKRRVYLVNATAWPLWYAAERLGVYEGLLERAANAGLLKALPYPNRDREKVYSSKSLLALGEQLSQGYTLEQILAKDNIHSTASTGTALPA